MSLWLGFCVWRNDLKAAKQQEEDFELQVAQQAAVAATEARAVQLEQFLRQTADERDSLVIQARILEDQIRQREETDAEWKVNLMPSGLGSDDRQTH